MLIYRSHWRDDPVFDRTNIDRVLPQLPCPEMDYELLMRVARYPIVNNFGLAKHEVVTRPLDAQNRLAPYLRRPVAGDDGKLCVTLQVNGSGGGQWHLFVRDGAVLGADLGLAPADAPRCYLNSATFASLARGEITVQQSIDAGRVFLQAPRGVRAEVVRAVQQLLSTTQPQ